jgi:hypothetical protein
MPYIEFAGLFVYLIVMPIAFIVCLAWILRESRYFAELSRFGSITEAKIVQLTTSAITRGRSYYVTYSFALSNEDGIEATYTNKQEISRKHYLKLKTNPHITIAYLPENPNISRLFNDSRDLTGRFKAIYWASLIGAVWVAILLNVLK